MTDCKTKAEARKVKAEAGKAALRRRLAEMLTVPNEGCLDILLSYKTRLLATRVAPAPYDEAASQMIRQLIADLATAVASLKHLAVLFDEGKAITETADEATAALYNAAQAWKAGSRISDADLDVLERTVDLLGDVLKETRISEYKAVLKLVEKELTP